MTAFVRQWFLSPVIAGFSLVLAVAPALASGSSACAYPAHKSHSVTRHTVSGSAILRIAQRHLYNLGYYKGGIDGIMGPQTRAAIVKFQREHGLKADGVVGGRTSRALENADRSGAGGGGASLGLGVLETVVGNDRGDPVVADAFAPGLKGGTRTIANRFARVDVSASGGASNQRYNVNLNGQAILVADNQPTVVGISQTYDLGNEDAIIFTTFSPDASGCVYRNHVLALSNQGSKLLDIDSCTRAFSAAAKNGSLFINFPQSDSNSAVGSTWRLEGPTLQKL